MTHSEFDQFFIETLQNIIADTKEYDAYIRTQTSRDYKDIRKDYAFTIKDLQRFLKKIHTIKDLEKLSVNQITRLYEYLQDYYDNFIISNEPEQKEKDLAYAAKLDKIMNLFVDADDENC